MCADTLRLACIQMNAIESCKRVHRKIHALRSFRRCAQIHLRHVIPGNAASILQLETHIETAIGGRNNFQF